MLVAMMILSLVAFLPTASTVDTNSDIINNIDFDKKSLEPFNETLDDFETVTTNPTAFLNDVSDGRVTLKLLGQKFNLDLKKIHIVSDDATITELNGSILPAPKSYSYKGTVVGKANSSVVLTAGDDVTVGDNVLIGEINVDNKSYFIEQTNKTYNNKVVHVVYSSDAIKKRKILVYNTA